MKNQYANPNIQIGIELPTSYFLLSLKRYKNYCTL